MSFGLYGTKVSAEILSDIPALQRKYREYPDVSMYWMMIDLVQSSNYRISMGPEAGYVRGESFFNLVKAAIRPYSTIRKFKEIGDAVLICSPSFRECLESGLLMNQGARHIAYTDGTPPYPFSIRIGIDFGIAKKVDRDWDDYLGKPLDRLSRIMSIRASSSNFILSSALMPHCDSVISEYADCLDVSLPKHFVPEMGKLINEEIFYHELRINHEKLSAFDDYFEEWKRSSELR